MKKSRLSTVLIALGAVLLLSAALYEGISYPWASLFAQIGWAELPADLPDPPPLSDSPYIVSDQSNPTAQNGAESRNPETRAIGIIKIPSIQLSENIVEGSGDQLCYGVGHVSGTARPGQPGNCVLAGHRVYVRMHPFRHLDKLEVGEAVILKMEEAQYTYEVIKCFEVEENESWVMDAPEEEDTILTLLTCTPVINPTKRLIVQARLAETTAAEDALG